MKQLMFFGLSLFLFFTVYPVASHEFICETDRYITIFDTKTLRGDASFNVIRLYKTQPLLKFYLRQVSVLSYAMRIGSQLSDLSENTIDHDYFYHAFSSLVDRYLNAYAYPSKWVSRTVPGQIDLVLSLPGEIVYYGENGEPASVDVGAFQYTIDPTGCCYYRCFKLLRQLDGLKVSRVISDFLQENKDTGYDLFSKQWKKELMYFMARYQKEIQLDFV